MAMCDTYVCVTLGVCWIVYDNENIRIQIQLIEMKYYKLCENVQVNPCIT